MVEASKDSDQLWFILRESMSTSKEDFVVFNTTFSRVKQNGLSLEECLRLVKTKGKPEDFSFHIYSKSMAAAVRLLSDESIRVTYELYCKKDPVVEIYIRDAKDPSPNTSKCPSYENSLRSRQNTASGRGRLVPELFIRPQDRHVSGSSDVYSMEVLKDESDRVTIRLGPSDILTLSKEYLICTTLMLLNPNRNILTFISRLDYIPTRRRQSSYGHRCPILGPREFHA
jgi:hypothetical protein